MQAPATAGDEAAISLLRRRRVRSELPKRPIDLQPRQCRLETCRRAIVAPRVIARESHSPTSDRIEDDIAHELEKMTFALNENSFESTLKEVADSIVLFVELDRTH